MEQPVPDWMYLGITVSTLGALICFALWIGRMWGEKQDDWWNQTEEAEELPWPPKGGEGKPVPEKETDLVSVR